jgi:hypothetical protein
MSYKEQFNDNIQSAIDKFDDYNENKTYNEQQYNYYCLVQNALINLEDRFINNILKEDDKKL